jgi:hypothetical protein
MDLNGTGVALLALGFVVIVGGVVIAHRHPAWDKVARDVSACGAAVLMLLVGVLELGLVDANPDPEPLRKAPVAGEFASHVSGDEATICTTFRGKSTIDPKVTALAVAALAPANSRRYFEGKVIVDPDGTWRANVTLGDPNDLRGGKWQITLVAMSKDLHDYLTSTNTKNASYWSSPDFPPGAVQLNSIAVQRTPHDSTC